MPLSYNLRLSDGTVLVVDHEGLITWLVDEGAMVQVVGATQWRPLHAFIAAERAAARPVSRQTKITAPLPLVPPPVKEETSSPGQQRPPSDLHVLAKEGADAAWSAEAGHRLEEILPEPGAARVSADEPIAQTSTPNDPVAPIRSKPVDDEVYPRPAASAWSEPLETGAIGKRSNLLVLADDVESPSSGNAGETSSPDEAPPIRLKPRDDAYEAPPTGGVDGGADGQRASAVARPPRREALRERGQVRRLPLGVAPTPRAPAPWAVVARRLLVGVEEPPRSSASPALHTAGWADPARR
jgi:hypothetical protein